MIDRATIQEQIEQARRMSNAIGADLDMLDGGIQLEPMAFAMTQIHRLAILAAVLDNLVTTCNHAIDRQRADAQNAARAKHAAR